MILNPDAAEFKAALTPDAERSAAGRFAFNGAHATISGFLALCIVADVALLDLPGQLRREWQIS
jgi:hypothetical protein